MQLAGRPVAKPAPRTVSHPAPLPPTHAASHGVGHAIQEAAHHVVVPQRSVARTVARTVSQPSLRHSLGVQVHPGHTLYSPHGTDIQSSGAGYGSKQANAFKKTAAYRQAIVETFWHQPDPVKNVIVRNAQASPSLEGNIVLGSIKQRAASLGLKPNLRAGTGKEINAGPTLFSAIGHMFAPKTVLGSSGTNKGTGTAGLADVSPTAAAVSSPTMFLGLKGAETVGKNAVKDAVKLGPQTIQAGYQIGKDLATGKYSNALHAVVDPYVQMLANPGKAFYGHPLNSLMMVAGPEAAAGRMAGAIGRSGALGSHLAEAASTVRAPLRLGSDIAGAEMPIQEARSYSPNVVTKAAQVSREKALRKRGIDPNVARPKPRALPRSIANAMNVGLEAKTRRILDEMTGVRQMQGREDRANAARSIRAARPDKRVQNIVSFIQQRIIRKPETAVKDIHKEINRLKTADNGVRSVKTIANRKQRRDLATALKHPELLQQAFDTADKLTAQGHAADAYLVDRGLLDPGQAVRSRVIPYAMAHMGVKYDHATNEFVDAHGNPVSTEKILDHLKANEVPDPAFVGHYPQKVAPWQFYQAYRAARGSLGGKRTGEAFRAGFYDHTYEGLVAQAARTAEAVTKAGLHDRIVSRVGIGKPKSMQDVGENGYFNRDEARQLAYASSHDDHGNPIPGAQKLVPVTAFGAQTPLSAIEKLQSPADLEHMDSFEQNVLQRAVDDAAQKGPGTRNVVLVPETAMDQAKRQFKPSSEGARRIGQVTQQFRRTVLPYSTHWMMQIGSEAVLRGLVAGVIDPRNLIAGRQLMKRLQSTEEGKNALREMVNSTFYNKHDPLARHNPNASATTQLLARTPIVRAHNLYADRVGAAMGGLEHEFRVMGLGKLARRQLQEFTGSYQAGLRLQGKNVELLAENLKTDPALVAKFGRQIDETFGKYNKLSPKVRAAVQSVVPFLPWYLNAARFVLWTLPAKHPVASALLASVRQTMNQDVADGKQLPLNPFQVSALARFTPFGIFPEKNNLGSAIETASDPILPQFTGAYNVLHGQNVFGDSPLTSPSGDIKAFDTRTIAPAVESLLESLLPALAQARTIRQGGGTAYGTSTILRPQTKPETAGGAKKILNRLFNPLHAFESAGSYAGASSGSSSSKASIGAAGGASLSHSLGTLGGADLGASLK